MHARMFLKPGLSEILHVELYLESHFFGFLNRLLFLKLLKSVIDVIIRKVIRYFSYERVL